jgi:hypothetical protein
MEKLQVQVTADRTQGADSLTLGLWRILKEDAYRTQLLIFMWAWLSICVIYYGLSFNTKHLSGNPYLNVFYLGLSDLPGCFSGIYFNNR